MAPLILNLGCVVRFVPQSLYSLKTRQYAFNRTVGHRDGPDVSEKRTKDLFGLPAAYSG